MANPNLLLAKAWDNRIGCALAAEMAKRLKGSSIRTRLIAVATVQEEVGLRGAQTSAHKVEPDVAFALDVGIAHDTPGTEGDEKLGGGPLMVVYDSSSDSESRAARSRHRYRERAAHSAAVRVGGARRHRCRPVPRQSARACRASPWACRRATSTATSASSTGATSRATVKLLVALVKRLDQRPSSADLRAGAGMSRPCSPRRSQHKLWKLPAWLPPDPERLGDIVLRLALSLLAAWVVAAAAVPVHRAAAAKCLVEGRTTTPSTACSARTR